MIFRCQIGDLSALLDDEMVDERPTPEVSRDYLRACSDQVLAIYQAMPDAAVVDGDGE